MGSADLLNPIVYCQFNGPTRALLWVQGWTAHPRHYTVRRHQGMLKVIGMREHISKPHGTHAPVVSQPHQWPVTSPALRYPGSSLCNKRPSMCAPEPFLIPLRLSLYPCVIAGTQKRPSVCVSMQACAGAQMSCSAAVSMHLLWVRQGNASEALPTQRPPSEWMEFKMATLTSWACRHQTIPLSYSLSLTCSVSHSGFSLFFHPLAGVPGGTFAVMETEDTRLSPSRLWLITMEGPSDVRVKSKAPL